MAALILNRLCDLLLEHHLQVHRKHDSYDFFERQFELLRANLTETEGKLQGFRAKHHISSLVEQRSLLLRQLADRRNELDLTLIQEVESRHRIKEFNQVLLDTPETVAQGEEIDHNPYIISSLQTRLVELELKQNDLLTKYNEESRLVRNTREEIEIVRQKLQEQEGKRYGKSQYGLNPTYQGLRESLLRNMAELKATAAKRQTQETQLASYEDNLRGLNSLESELKQLQYEADVALESFRLYQKKREESRISQAMDSDKIVNFSIMESAIPPLRPIKPNINLMLLIGIIFGLIGSFFLALTLEYIRDTLERPEEVEDFLRLPVLASIPELRSGGKFALLRSVQIRHPASAA